MGYPTSMANHTLTWNKSGTLNQWDQTTYEYNIENQLIQKVGSGITTNYYAINHKIHQINIGTNILKFFYALDKLVYFTYNGTRYFYVFNAQNDITHLVDDTGNVVASYIYDAWGNHQVLDASGVENTNSDFIGNINPIRYRGYYFDVETNLYYLNSRYYDPEVGRFISLDAVDYLAPDSIHGLNLFAYCFNNPIMYADPSGCFPILALILGITALTGLGLTIGGVASDNNTITAIGLTMVAIPALISGGMGLACFGAWETMTVGGVTTGAGLFAGLFASAEYQEAFTGGNWIKDTTEMSEGLYNGLMLSIAAVATAGTIASMVGVTGYQNYGNGNWLNGWREMRSHYLKHGRLEMGYRRVFDYTNGANAIINNGGVYLSNANSYAQWIAGNKYLYVGVGRGSNLITTYSIRTIKYAKSLSLL